jgi:hypothetical protein
MVNRGINDEQQKLLLAEKEKAQHNFCHWNNGKDENLLEGFFASSFRSRL